MSNKNTTLAECEFFHRFRNGIFKPKHVASPEVYYYFFFNNWTQTDKIVPNKSCRFAEMKDPMT